MERGEWLRRLVAALGPGKERGDGVMKSNHGHGWLSWAR